MKNKKLMREVRDMIRSVVRLLPTFLILAVVTALFGYGVLGIHDDRLGVVITVPLVAAFGLSRALVLSVPRNLKKSAPVEAPTKFVGIAAFITALSITLFIGSSAILMASAVLYRAIGMPNAAMKSLEWSVYGAASCVFVVVFMTALIALSRLSLLEWVVSLCVKVASLFWNVLCAPTRIARFLGESIHLSHSH